MPRSLPPSCSGGSCARCCKPFMVSTSSWWNSWITSSRRPVSFRLRQKAKVSSGGRESKGEPQNPRRGVLTVTRSGFPFWPLEGEKSSQAVGAGCWGKAQPERAPAGGAAGKGPVFPTLYHTNRTRMLQRSLLLRAHQRSENDFTTPPDFYFSPRLEPHQALGLCFDTLRNFIPRRRCSQTAHRQEARQPQAPGSGK